MATLYVSEYRQLASVPSGTNYAPQPAQAPQEPPLAEYTIAITGSSTAGQFLNAYTAMVRVHADAICSVVIGAGPVATTINKRLAANQTEYFGVAANAANQVAVIQNV